MSSCSPEMSHSYPQNTKTQPVFSSTDLNDNSDIEWSLLLNAVHWHETPAVMVMPMCRQCQWHSAGSARTACAAASEVNSLQIVSVQFKLTVCSPGQQECEDHSVVRDSMNNSWFWCSLNHVPNMLILSSLPSQCPLPQQDRIYTKNSPSFLLLYFFISVFHSCI